MRKKRNMEWTKTETCLSLRVPKTLIADLDARIERKAKSAGIPVPTTSAYIRMLIERDIQESRAEKPGTR